MLAPARTSSVPDFPDQFAPPSKPFRSFDIPKGTTPETFDERTESTILRRRTRFLSIQNALLVGSRLLHGGVDRNNDLAMCRIDLSRRLLHGGVDRNIYQIWLNNALQLVASFTGAWIETICGRLACMASIVASFTGAWIETYRGAGIGRQQTSPPSRGRGSKQSRR